MLLRLLHRLKSVLIFLTAPEPILSINGSKIVFKPDGSFYIHADKHIVLESKLNFTNCDPRQVKRLMEAYDQGNDEYNRVLSQMQKDAIDEAIADASVQKALEQGQANCPECRGAIL